MEYSRIGKQNQEGVGLHMLNSLPQILKSFSRFKNLMKDWFGPKCKCRAAVTCLSKKY